MGSYLWTKAEPETSSDEEREIISEMTEVDECESRNTRRHTVGDWPFDWKKV